MDYHYIWKAFCHLQANGHKIKLDIQSPRYWKTKADNGMSGSVCILPKLLTKTYDLLL